MDEFFVKHLQDKSLLSTVIDDILADNKLLVKVDIR
jgi:hypothetical protein